MSKEQKDLVAKFGLMMFIAGLALGLLILCFVMWAMGVK